MREFIEVDKYGQLYFDKILFESYFPIIFTCINDRNDIFIGVCCQNNERGCKWLLGKTDCISIVRMLRDEITIRQLLLECSTERISADYAGNGYIVAYNNSDWDENSPFLPKEDSYMYAEDGEFEDEIQYFLSLDNQVHYGAECYQCIAETFGTINKGMESAADVLPTIFASAIGNLSISGEVVSTLRVFGKLSAGFAVNTDKYKNQEEYKSILSRSFNMVSEDFNIIKVESGNCNDTNAA